MLRRSARSRFMPDAFVFPGGTVDARDSSEAMRARTTGLDEAHGGGEFRATTPGSLPHDVAPIDDGDGPALKIAALRELFEEAGVLLVPGDAISDDREIEAARKQIHAGERTFSEYLEHHDLFVDAGALTLFSHWITPPSEPRRYNTHFFLARMPGGQTAIADTYETHDGIWISPADALARDRAGEFRLVYPTIKHLERLRAFGSIDTLIDYARTKPILTIVPTGTIAEGFAMPPELENAW